MKIFFRLFLTALLAVFLAPKAGAQLYVTDDVQVDSVSYHAIEKSKTSDAEIMGGVVGKLPLGVTVRVERALHGNASYALIRIDGKAYGISSSDLIFSDENPEGVEDIFGNTRERINHTWRGRFFASMTPYTLIAVLFLVAIVFTYLGLTVESLRPIALMVIPAAILLASLLEIWAYMTWGTRAFWWCSYDRYGFFGSLFRAIPFIVFVAYQLFSVKFYKRILVGEDAEDDLSLKPMAISIGACVPVFLVTVILFTLLGSKGLLRDVVSVAAFLVSLGIGLWISAKRNMETLGRIPGIAFTAFAGVYIIGAIVSVIGLAVVLFQLIFQVLIICAAIVGLGMAMGEGGGSDSGSGGGGGSTTSAVWIDEEGGRHTNSVDAEAANKRIAERKANR